MAQQLVEKRGLKNQDLARTGRMTLYGGGMFYFISCHTAYHPLSNLPNQLSLVPLQQHGLNSSNVKSVSLDRQI